MAPPPVPIACSIYPAPRRASEPTLFTVTDDRVYFRAHLDTGISLIWIEAFGAGALKEPTES